MTAFWSVVEVRRRGARVVAPAPRRVVDDHRGGRGLGLRPERLGQRAHQLAQRGLELGRGRRRRAGHEEQGAGLGRVQPAEVGAGAADELPAAVAALAGVDGHAGHAERLEVAAGGALRHLELLGDLRRGDLAARLEEHEDGHQPVGAHRPILAHKPVTR